MRRIDRQTVELTDRESKVYERFHELMDEGWSLTMAAQRVIKDNPQLSNSFQAWLYD